VVSD